MGLSNPWHIEQVWGSHQPILKAVVKTLKPQTIVECGCGNYSTPNLPGSLVIEHDINWLTKIQKEYPAHEYHHIRVNAKNSTKWDELSIPVRQKLTQAYEDIAKKFKSIDFLFVDTFTCARVVALKALMPLAKVILLHDVRPHSQRHYSYHKIDFRKLYRYEHRPDGWVLAKCHPIPWTALYSKSSLSLYDLNITVAEDSMRLWKKPYKLERIYD